MLITFALCLIMPELAASKLLSAGWWEQISAEDVWLKAQSATREVKYFSGIKYNPKNEGDITFKYWQRRMTNGNTEIKRATYDKDGRLLNAEYEIPNGKYFYGHGAVVKIESGDLEDQLAATVNDPYNYKILDSTIVGTNDCIVVARTMSPSFLNIMKNKLYKDYSPQQEAAFGGDFRKYISSETDCYIRKSDAVSIGFIERNNVGDILVDRLYNTVQIDRPIPESEFLIPTVPMEKREVATTFKQFQKIDSKLISDSERQMPLSASAIMWRRAAIIVIMAVSLGILFSVLSIRLRQGTANRQN